MVKSGFLIINSFPRLEEVEEGEACEFHYQDSEEFIKDCWLRKDIDHGSGD